MLQPCNLYLTEGKGLIEYSIPKSSEMTVNLVRFESVGRGDKKGQQLAAEDKGN